MRGSVIRRKNGKYAIKWYANGRQYLKTIGPRKKEAEAALAEKISEVANGIFQPPKEIAFSDFAKMWFDGYVKANCRLSTQNDYRLTIRNHLIPFFGNIKLNKISPVMVQAYISAKVDEGKIKPKTINNTLIVLKLMFRHSIEWGYLRVSPTRFIKNLRVPREEMQILQPEEIRLFLANCSAKFYPLAVTAVFTGMRRGELIGLKWSDIDWNKGQIYVGRSVYDGKFVEPKSESSRRAINMAPILIDTLKKHRETQKNANKVIELAGYLESLDLVFPNGEGKPQNPQNLLARQFYPALKKAGLKKIPFHSLRHTFASLLIHQGESIKYIQHQLGHASVQITLDRYGHLLPEVHTGAGARLEKTVFAGSESQNCIKTVSQS